VGDNQLAPAKAMALHSLGREEEADAELARARASLEARLAAGPQTQAASESAFGLAQACAWLGQPDCAFESLEVAIKDEPDRPFYFGDELFHPLYVNLHADARWSALVERLGIAPEQLAAIEFNVTLPP
jgi:tetratricopeptide (TPR) repeat protein